jgi:lipopolysaccharide/colanic/teichoic acid biosynthesis glycosyltransferase
MPEPKRGLRRDHAVLKRGFDLIVSASVLIAGWWLILAAWCIARIDTGGSGFFVQERIGRHGRPFRMLKVRTMRCVGASDSTVTVAGDPRITRIGAVLRRWRIDELPQFIHVLSGRMSLVGPRPDVAGFADRLEGDDRIVLSVRPGLTGPATLKYRDEETLLAAVDDPERFNREVIFPDKTRLNRAYVEHWSIGEDLRCIWRTVWRIRRGVVLPSRAAVSAPPRDEHDSVLGDPPRGGILPTTDPPRTHVCTVQAAQSIH